MSTEFEKHTITDFGQKLAHIAGVLGAYLPSYVFKSEVQKRTIECDKFSFSRLKLGKRPAANWELARFIEMFDLSRYGFDYQLFLLPFDAFGAELKRAGVGSYGTSVAAQFRERLRGMIRPVAEIKIVRGLKLNVGGIGHIEEASSLLSLTQRDKVRLEVPLVPAAFKDNYFLLLHDFPLNRETSTLMPSIFTITSQVEGNTLRLPQVASGYEVFPVGGEPGYRCLYGIQSSMNLADLIGVQDSDSTVPKLMPHQIALLVDQLTNKPDQVHVSFGEYFLKE